MTPWLGAYVTPNEPQLMKFLRSAANRHPEGRLTGYQEVVEPQVEAIFSALKEDAQLVYISSIVSSFPDSTVATQRVRLPRESVMERQANALDATLLFASLLEAIGLNPALVLVPGHALLGWEKKEDSDTWDYLETTMIGTHAFDEAVATGRKMVESYQSQFQERGDSPYFHRHALSELRAAGISPLG